VNVLCVKFGGAASEGGMEAVVVSCKSESRHRRVFAGWSMNWANSQHVSFK